MLGDNELLLKVAFTGICGSDLHAAETPGALPPGTVMGHEFTGEIVQSTSPDWQFGERVVANPLWICDVCANGGKCHSGRDPACANSCFMGFKPEVPGAYAEYVRIRASQAIRLPDNVSLRDGALIEPLAVAGHAVDVCGRVKDDNVLVIGGGPIGLGVLLMSIDAGAATVVVSEPDADRRACALKLGAAAAIDPTVEDLSSAMPVSASDHPTSCSNASALPAFFSRPSTSWPLGRAPSSSVSA